MEKVELEGTISSKDPLKESISKIRDMARQFFGTSCLEVTLHQAVLSAGSGVATIKWTVREHHPMERPSYGFPRCHGCRKTEPDLGL